MFHASRKDTDAWMPSSVTVVSTSSLRCRTPSLREIKRGTQGAAGGRHPRAWRMLLPSALRAAGATWMHSASLEVVCSAHTEAQAKEEGLATLGALDPKVVRLQLSTQGSVKSHTKGRVAKSHTGPLDDHRGRPHR